MKKHELNEYVYDFCVDYNIIDDRNTKDIHTYLTKKMAFYKIILRLKKEMFITSFFFTKSDILR